MLPKFDRLLKIFRGLFYSTPKPNHLKFPSRFCLDGAMCQWHMLSAGAERDLLVISSQGQVYQGFDAIQKTRL